MSDRPGNRIPEPEDLGSLLEALASRPAEDIEGPQLQEAAERRAARAGKSIDAMLTEDRARLRQSRYPGPECIQPYEIEQYLLGSLKAERMAHCSTCAACSALLHAAMPSESGAERIVNEVRETVKALGRVPAAERVAGWRAWLPKPRPIPRLADGFVIQFGAALGFLTDVLAATLPVLVAISGVVLLYRFARPLPEAPEVAWTMAAITLQPAFIAFVVSVALTMVTAWLVSRVHVGRAVFRASGGALAAGVVLAVVAGGYTWWDLGQRARQIQASLTLVSARLAQVVAASLDVRRSTGAFPLVERNEGGVALTTALHAPDRVVYRADSKALKGTVIAEVGPGGGTVYWDHAGESKQVARLVMGTIDTVTWDGIVLREQRGMTVTIKAPPDPTRRRGEEVVAIVDQRTNTATGVYPVANVTPR